MKQTQQSRQKDKERKLTAKYTAQRRRSKYQSSEQTSLHYGPNAVQPDLARSELDKICQENKYQLYVSDLEQSNIEQQTKDQAENNTGVMVRTKMKQTHHIQFWYCCQTTVYNSVYTPGKAALV